MGHAAERIGVRDFVGEAEWRQRVELAACYRLLAHYGWDDHIYTHSTVRIPGTDHFLINPFGLKFEEVTASSLVKIDCDGKKVMDSDNDYLLAGFVVHSAIHLGRDDAHCVIHTHTKAGCAVAAQKDGLLMLNQKTMQFYNRIGYHDYEGFADDLEERDRMAASIGPHPALIMRNHGLLTVGATMAEAFTRMRRLHEACEIQLAAQAGGGELVIPSPETCEHAAQQFERAGGLWEKEWAAELRLLDRLDPSYAD
ncbi:MAG: class II aldolase/adducin family protein [Rhodospirillaceae bacterium]